MKHFLPTLKVVWCAAAHQLIGGLGAILIGLFTPCLLYSQAVTGIITDYNGFWKSTAATINTVKPDNSHNLLAFTYKGSQYSTGVNDALLASKGEVFTPADFWALPVNGMTGQINGNTKVGLGALYDGVAYGSSVPAPEYGVEKYLTDGIKGLDLGTCIANLPSGSMTFLAQNIQPSSIGDGIPDILVTQVADPSNSFDSYEFTDAAGNRVGSPINIVFNNISPVGNWTADFYDLKGNTLVLAAGFTQTDRPMRLWAADLSELGITQANYKQIKNFKINLCGNSDVAFVAYNNKSLSFEGTLPVQYSFLKGTVYNRQAQLSWQTTCEVNAKEYVVEKSSNGTAFVPVGTVIAKNSNGINNYVFTDQLPLTATAFYRLKQVDVNGAFSLSTVLKLAPALPGAALNVYPSPARGVVYVQHPPAAASKNLGVYNASGYLFTSQRVSQSSTQTKVDIITLKPGVYFVVYESNGKRLSQQFAVQ